jgi:hypothetical protein
MARSYHCVVFASAGHVSYTPSATVVGRLVKALTEAGWLDEVGDAPLLDAHAEGKTPKQVRVRSRRGSDVASALAKVKGNSYVLTFDNAILPAPNRAPFEEDKRGVFRAPHCSDLFIGVSEYPLLVEDRGYPKDKTSCTRCKRNPVLLFDGKVGGSGLLLSSTLFLPARCPHCGVSLDPESLTMKLDYACDRKRPAVERAPFFRFSVSLGEDAPKLTRIRLDPSLPALLKKVCGVPFRSYGKLLR